MVHNVTKVCVARLIIHITPLMQFVGDAVHIYIKMLCCPRIVITIYYVLLRKNLCYINYLLFSSYFW